jgi:hypothetical protein
MLKPVSLVMRHLIMVQLKELSDYLETIFESLDCLFHRINLRRNFFVKIVDLRSQNASAFGVANFRQELDRNFQDSFDCL